MDFRSNIVLKEDYTFLVLDADGGMNGGEKGLYNHDTRFLKYYHWDFGEGFQQLLSYSPDAAHYHSHHGRMAGDEQAAGVTIRLTLTAEGFIEHLNFQNTGDEYLQWDITLKTKTDFSDLFGVRGLHSHTPAAAELTPRPGGLHYHYTAADGIESGLTVTTDPAPDKTEQGKLHFTLHLAPGESRHITAKVKIQSGLINAGLPHTGQGDVTAGRLSYRQWRSAFSRGSDNPVVKIAVDDLRALLLFTEYGPVPAAGIPWYGAVFGRDALLTAYLLLPRCPEVAVSVLRYLAAYQGREYNPYTHEQPGKILHEIRFGELSRTGQVPHHPYYGSIDATPLFIMLLHRYVHCTGDRSLGHELRNHWEAALAWMLQDGDSDGDGFLEYTAADHDKGLTVQSWKDSGNSMSHRDGSLAQGAIAPSEVQGYMYAAYKAASEFYQWLQEKETAHAWSEKAGELQCRFHDVFWQEDMGTYAMALDGQQQPLQVQNSNAGHLLFTGIARSEVLPPLVESLFSADLWSGWGIRTLGSREARYNPISYHNGSVWPHDTALIAGGLLLYGYEREADLLRRALLDLALSQEDDRLPELVAGYARISGQPPVSYPVACRPQAWDAAALLHLSYM